MKFITTQTEQEVLEIFLFPRSIDHDAMLESITLVRKQTTGNWVRIYRTAVSAGFVDASFRCYGESETLSLKASEEDTLLLKKQLHQFS